MADWLRAQVHTVWSRKVGLPQCSPADLHVQTAPPAVGQFRVDLRPLAAKGIDKATCQAIVTELSRELGVQRAVAIPPRCYVTYSADFLARHVPRTADKTIWSGTDPGEGRTVLVNFGNPNANKPLHIGHVRDIVLGSALCSLFESAGWRVLRSQTISDWGIHIWRAAVGYRQWGGGQTPAEAGVKPDHFVGSFLTRYHQQRASEIEQGMAPEGVAPIEVEARTAHLAAEEGDPSSLRLVGQVTRWAEEGFEATYQRLGIAFDVVLYESKTHDLSHQLVELGVGREILRRRFDQSVFVDLTAEGLFRVPLKQRDGSLTVFGQLIGVQADLHARHNLDRVFVVVGATRKRDFRCNQALWSRLGCEWAERYEGIALGFVKFPSGGRRPRTGAGVTADEILDRIAAHFAVGGRDSDSTCVLLATALISYWLLGIKRHMDAEYDEDHLVEMMRNEFGRLLRAYVDTAAFVGGEVDVDRVGQLDAAGADVVRLLLLIDGLPAALARSLHLRDPVVVVRLIRDLAVALTQTRDLSGLPPGLAGLAGSALREALAAVGIVLPEPADVAEHMELQPGRVG